MLPSARPLGGLNSVSIGEIKPGESVVRGTAPIGFTAVCRKYIDGVPTTLGDATVSITGAVTYNLASPAVAGDRYDFYATLRIASLTATVPNIGGLLGPTTASFTIGAPANSSILVFNGLGPGEFVQTQSPNDGRGVLDQNGLAFLIGSSASSPGDTLYTFTTNLGRVLKTTVTALSLVQPILTKTLGSATAASVSFAQLPAGASITNPSSTPGSYFTVNATTGVVSTTAAFVSAALGSVTLNVAVRDAGDITTLRVVIAAGEVDVDTGSRLTSAITAAAVGATIGLTDTFVDGAAVTISRVFSGEITHPHKGIGPAESILDPTCLTDSAVPKLTGGLVIKARTLFAPRFNFKVTLNGPENIALDGFAFRNVATSDSYNAKFNEVLPQNEVIWIPTLSNGAVTGVSSFVQTGKGYLASKNERRVYISHNKPTTVVGITNTKAAQLVVTYPNHGLAAGRAIRFNTDGVLPRPLSSLLSDSFFVKEVLSADTFTVSMTSTGVAVTVSEPGSGTHYCGPGSGFLGWFDPDEFGNINETTPLTIVSPGQGYDATMRFRQPRVGETTQLANCQSNIATAESAVQLGFSQNTLSKVIVRNCSFGNPGGSVNRIPWCIDLRNAEQAYIHDCVFDNYYIALQVWQCNDGEIARCLSAGNANDFYREYTANSPLGNQLATGPLFRVLGNVGVDPMSAVDWSNSHADWMQVGTQLDLSLQHRTVLRFNRVYWPGNILKFQTQPILNTQGWIAYYFDISDNLFISSTQNYQLGSAVNKDLCRFSRNTCIRYIEEWTDLNAFSPKYPSCVEPWMNYRGPWSGTTSYAYGHVVKVDGIYYSSKIDGNLGNAVSDTAKWFPNYVYDVGIYDNIMGQIWANVPNATGQDRVSFLQDPANDDGVFTKECFNFHAKGNFYSSNYTESGPTSFPQIFTGARRSSTPTRCRAMSSGIGGTSPRCRRTRSQPPGPPSTPRSRPAPGRPRPVGATCRRAACRPTRCGPPTPIASPSKTDLAHS
ncbi:hypothetical protein ACFQWF_01315 [Methylorubrum suomiense]